MPGPGSLWGMVFLVSGPFWGYTRGGGYVIERLGGYTRGVSILGVVIPEGIDILGVVGVGIHMNDCSCMIVFIMLVINV